MVLYLRMKSITKGVFRTIFSPLEMTSQTSAKMDFRYSEKRHFGTNSFSFSCQWHHIFAA